MSLKEPTQTSDPWLLGPSRICIESNGSKFAGDPPDPLSMLFARLEQYPLDPTWEDLGGFACLAHGAIPYRGYDERGNRVTYYQDTGPIYKDAPYAVAISGSFYTLSAVFSIVTDDSEVVEALLEAIRANQQSPAYQKARMEVEKR